MNAEAISKRREKQRVKANSSKSKPSTSASPTVVKDARGMREEEDKSPLAQSSSAQSSLVQSSLIQPSLIQSSLTQSPSSHRRGIKRPAETHEYENCHLRWATLRQHWLDVMIITSKVITYIRPSNQIAIHHLTK